MLSGHNSKSDIVGKNTLETIVPNYKERVLVDMRNLFKLVFKEL